MLINQYLPKKNNPYSLLPNCHAQEDYREDNAAYFNLLELVVHSLDEASRSGVPLLSGEVLHPIPVGNKGDWPYLVASLLSFICWI